MHTTPRHAGQNVTAEQPGQTTPTTASEKRLQMKSVWKTKMATVIMSSFRGCCQLYYPNRRSDGLLSYPSETCEGGDPRRL